MYSINANFTRAAIEFRDRVSGLMSVGARHMTMKRLVVFFSFYFFPVEVATGDGGGEGEF